MSVTEPGWEPPTQEYVELFANQRDGLYQVHAHHERPLDALIPAQDVAGEIEQDGEDEQRQSKQVVETPRRGVSSGEHNADKVYGADDEQELGGPEMQVAHQSAKRNQETEGLDREGSFIRRGHIVEHFQNAGYDQYQREEDRRSACTQRIAPAGLFRRDGRRVDVVEEVRTHDAVDYIIPTVKNCAFHLLK